MADIDSEEMKPLCPICHKEIDRPSDAIFDSKHHGFIHKQHLVSGEGDTEIDKLKRNTASARIGTGLVPTAKPETNRSKLSEGLEKAHNAKLKASDFPPDKHFLFRTPFGASHRARGYEKPSDERN